MPRMKISFCTYQGGGFDVIVIDPETDQEVTLSGDQKISDEEFETLNKLAPACVFTTYEASE